MNNYFCVKCSTLIQKLDTPHAATCHGGENHTWTNLGPIGTRIYNCNKCNTTIRSAGRPVAGTCPVETTHNWNEL